MSDDAPAISLKEAITSAIRYWEPRRLLYNAALVVVVVAYFIAGLPKTKSAIGTELLLSLFVLAIVANICYCAAYVVELFVQLSGFRDTWLRSRWILLLIGTAFAATLARWFALAAFETKLN